MSDLISRLSELRCQYNCFDENERDAYHTLSESIKALSDVPDTNVGDTISRQAALNVLCDNCDTVQAVCPHYPCKRYTSIEALPSVDELTIVTEYCRKRNLVIITMESFRVLQTYYNRQNGMDGEQDVYSK